MLDTALDQWNSEISEPFRLRQTSFDGWILGAPLGILLHFSMPVAPIHCHESKVVRPNICCFPAYLPDLAQAEALARFLQPLPISDHRLRAGAFSVMCFY